MFLFIYLFIYSVVQGAGDETCRPDRFSEDVQHSVCTGYGKGCRAALWWAGHHADRNGPLHRACESFPGCLTALFTNPFFYHAKYHRTVTFDAILGGGKTSFYNLSSRFFLREIIYSGGRTRRSRCSASHARHAQELTPLVLEHNIVKFVVAARRL